VVFGVRFYLWQAVLSKGEEEFFDCVEGVLWSLCNFVNVYVVGGVFECLWWYVDWVLE